MVKHLSIAILLSILIPGWGQIYLGYFKRGIVILLTGIAMGILLYLILPLPLPLIGVVFWFWQIIDAIILHKNSKIGIITNNKIVCSECDSESTIDTEYCTNCGYHLKKTCLNCGQLNIQGASYCSKCGNEIIN